MPDVSTIATAISSIKTATEIAKFLRQTDLSLEKAELKLKLADLFGALADAKMELAQVQEILNRKDEEIAELRAALTLKLSLVRHKDAYYALSPSGSPTGMPFCPRCWEEGHKARQLVRVLGNPRVRACPTCGQHYDSVYAGMIEERV